MLAGRARLALGWLAVVGCVPGPAVERAYGDRTIEGRFVEAAAYAAFLRGAIAEAEGDAAGALASYEHAARIDPDAPEIWARLGAIRCKAAPADARADEALRRALALDARFARAWSERARCARSRGDEAGARDAAARAAALDAAADDANALLLAGAPAGRDAQTRSALVALTMTARDRVLAWETLRAWAESHGDVALWARSLAELARTTQARREQAARAAEQLAAAGHLAEARALAAAAADASDEPLPVDRFALAARLAVDEAIARQDGPAARARATRTRVALEEVAGRALLAGEAGLAREIASSVARADPGALGARLVLAASEGRDLLGAAHRVDGKEGAVVSAAALVAFGSGLVHSVTPGEARATLARIAHEPLVPGDARVVARAAELVACGALDKGLLPADPTPARPPTAAVP